MSAAGSELATFLGKYLSPREYAHVASLVRLLEEEAFRKGEKWNDRQWRLGLQGGEIRFTGLTEADTTGAASAPKEG